MIPDKQIQHDVTEELKWEPITNPAAISVAVNGGIVSLSGRVTTYLQRQAAGQAARRVRGVKAVVEDIQVQPGAAHMVSDEAISAAAAQLIAWHTEVPSKRIRIKVEDAHLTLDGDVDWQYQKDAAYDAVKSIAGIKDISNFLFVRPDANAVLIAEDIERALHRKADLHAHQISVSAMGNRVVLSGRVATWAERQMAEYAVWSSPGVADVVDNLVVASQPF